MSSPEQQAMAVAEAFLQAVSNRNLERAAALTADDFNMVVSGGHQFDNLPSFVAYSGTRQRSVAKHTDRFEALTAEDGVVVYCFGTMSGAWLDGSPYQNVRYIDRFLIRNGKIAAMNVWSDMADFRPPDPPAT
jgi:ketosteroid isomerase-like protein